MFENSKLSHQDIDIIKAHDTNAFSEGRNNADRQAFNQKARETYRNAHAKLELIEQVTFHNHEINIKKS